MRVFRLPLLLALGLLATALPSAALPSAALPSAGDDLARWVDPMVGTFAPGFTVPGAATPFGMVQASPDTDGEFAYSGYLWTDPYIRGFSLVHLSGPGVKKGGDLPFLPTTGAVDSSDPRRYGSPFDHATEEASPGYYRVRLARYATDVELTATTRVGLQRYTFPPAPTGNVLFDVSRSIEGIREGTIEIIGDDEVAGSVRGRYPVHFVAKFSRPFVSFGTWHGATLAAGARSANGTGVGGWASFDTSAKHDVTVKVGVSFVDVAGARRNLESEVPGWDFEGVRAAARAAWNRELGRIRVSGGLDTDRRAFYTALYHALLHPNVFNDVDGRYLGFDQRTHVAQGRTQYANFSSWDTYKAQNQLLAMLDPARYREMLLSLLAAAEQGGKLPRWGEHNFDASHMSGDPVIPMIADGFCRGVFEPGDEAVVDALFAEMHELVERREPEVHKLGYVPVDRSSRGTGTTLEYGVADFALALMASALGRGDEQRDALERSRNWRNVFDPETRWVRPRKADSSWHAPFDPAEEYGFQEGNSWQYSWLAPHDARALYDAMGGDAAAVERLDHLFAYELSARAPVVVAEAHSRLNVFGLVYRTPTYAPGNEHDLQVPWMYAFAGQPHKTQAVLRQVQGLFRPTPDGLPGNDDLGSLSAWHVFSALGFGPVVPGAPFYVVGSPLFERAQIALPGDRVFTLEAPGASLAAKYVGRASVDGRPLEQAWFAHDIVASGRTVRLEMRTEPNRIWGAAPALRPPSLASHPLAAFACRAGA